MSTKIYNAYRLKNSADLWPFIRDVHWNSKRAVQMVLRGLVLKHMSALAAPDARDVELCGSEQRARFEQACRHVEAGYYAQLGSIARNDFDFDVYLVVREHDGRIYLVAKCDMLMRDTLDCLRDDSRVEDYSYWNNTDKPDDVTDEAWEQRRSIWHALSDSGWGDYMTVPICDAQSICMLMPTWSDVEAST